MRKKVRIMMDCKKRNHKGFTIIEFLTAIAIVAILSVSVFFAMSTSSKTYNRLSVEAQLQSEAQLVANMITELAIDSFDASNALPDSTTYNQNYDEADGNILILESTQDAVKKQYVVGKKQGADKLYLAERTYNATNDTWGALTESLLGEYISGFSVDTSRVEQENVLQFTISYTKNGRTYDGNYQVLMRNRAYADRDNGPEDPESTPVIALDVSPKLVYIDVVNNLVPQYYVGEVSSSGKRTDVSQGVKFNVTVRPKSDTNKGCDWRLKNADTDMFELSETANAESTYLKWKDTKQFIDSPNDTFTLVASKTITLDDGETTVSATPKTAQVLLRRIKGISLYALTGSTQWRKEFTEQYGGIPNEEAQGYAYMGNGGSYLPMTVSASISSSNIEYGGGLKWKIMQKSASGTWSEVTNSSLVSLKSSETLTSTTNVVNFGAAVKNGDLYKVVATSVFDPSFEAEYVFGIAPSGGSDGDGFYSRGYYTDLGALIKLHGRERVGKGNGNDGYNFLHDDMLDPVKIVYLKVTSVDGCGEDGSSDDKVKVIKDADGNWRLFINYDAFSYSGEQRGDLYTEGLLIHVTVGYYDTKGNLCIVGEECKKYKKELEDQEGRKVPPSYTENGHTWYCEQEYDAAYVPKAVVTTKVSPVTDVLVVAKGKSQSVTAKTAYYNIVSPRNGMYYFGAYLNDMNNNLVEPGKSSVNPYFEVNMTSAYGDTNKYVDTATIELKAKAVSAQKKYLTSPMTLRLTANDYYLINKTPDQNSYTSYDVLIANVEGTDAYIAGPKATGALAWSSEQATNIEAETKTKVTGQNSAGSSVEATVYKEGKKYYCVYGGRTYTYNLTYNFWAD